VRGLGTLGPAMRFGFGQVGCDGSVTTASVRPRINESLYKTDHFYQKCDLTTSWFTLFSSQFFIIVPIIDGMSNAIEIQADQLAKPIVGRENESAGRSPHDHA
jgi:hypothetical protein